MRHFHPIGVLGFDIQKGAGGAVPRALGGERPLKPPPASAAVTPRTGRSPVPAPFNLRRRGGGSRGLPAPGISRQLCAASRRRQEHVERPGSQSGSSSPAQLGGKMEGEPPARFFSKGSLKSSTGARSRESSFWISVLLLFISLVKSKYEAFQRAKRVGSHTSLICPLPPRLTLESDNFSAVLFLRGCQGSTISLQRKNTYGATLKCQQTWVGTTSPFECFFVHGLSVH